MKMVLGQEKDQVLTGSQQFHYVEKQAKTESGSVRWTPKFGQVAKSESRS